MLGFFFDTLEFSLTNPFYFRVSLHHLPPRGFINQRSSLFQV